MRRVLLLLGRVSVQCRIQSPLCGQGVSVIGFCLAAPRGCWKRNRGRKTANASRQSNDMGYLLCAPCLHTTTVYVGVAAGTREQRQQSAWGSGRERLVRNEGWGGAAARAHPVLARSSTCRSKPLCAELHTETRNSRLDARPWSRNMPFPRTAADRNRALGLMGVTTDIPRPALEDQTRLHPRAGCTGSPALVGTDWRLTGTPPFCVHRGQLGVQSRRVWTIRHCAQPATIHGPIPASTEFTAGSEARMRKQLDLTRCQQKTAGAQESYKRSDE
jgi:hypothetical protein